RLMALHLLFQLRGSGPDAVLELGVRGLERVGGRALRGEVAGDLREPDYPRSEPPRHAAAIETRAVLAHVPALVCRAPVASRFDELAPRRIGDAVLRREQHVRLGADD